MYIYMIVILFSTARVFQLLAEQAECRELLDDVFPAVRSRVGGSGLQRAALSSLSHSVFLKVRTALWVGLSVLINNYD